MRVGSIFSRDLVTEGARLNGGFHLAEDQQAWRELLHIPSSKKSKIEHVVRDRGVFRGPIFTRTFCSDPKLGRPYVSPAELERADIRTDRYLAASHGALLPQLELKRGMVLVTCSGMSLGRAIFVRRSMEGVCASHDLIRIEVDDDRIPPGFLYGFLRSRHGYVAMRRSIYGGNIKHIEPHHVASVGVPRFDASLELRIHRAIGDSVRLLEAYEEAIIGATALLFESVGMRDIAAHEWQADGPDLGFEVDGPSVDSLRAVNFNPRYAALVARVKRGRWRPLGELCVAGSLHRGGRFKRIDAAPEHSYKLIGQRDLFWLRPEGRWIARFAAGADVLVQPGTILVAARGTLGESELYCRGEFIWGRAVESAYSEDLLRIVADPAKMLSGCLFAFIRSEMAFRMLRSISTGTKLQDHHRVLLARLPVPIPDETRRKEIHDLVVNAHEARHKAVSLEEDAISLIEGAVENGAH